MSDQKTVSERELKLTAIVYTLQGAAKHLQATGKLPETIGGPWGVIPMRLAIKRRGDDPTLTEDEQLVYDAILKEGRWRIGADKQKPTLVLLNPKTMTLDDVLAMFRKLTGREPTEAAKVRCRAKWAEIEKRRSETATKADSSAPVPKKSQIIDATDQGGG